MRIEKRQTTRKLHCNAAHFQYEIYFRWLFNCKMRSLAFELIYRSTAFYYSCQFSSALLSSCVHLLAAWHAFTFYIAHLFINFVCVSLFPTNDGKQLQFSYLFFSLPFILIKSHFYALNANCI